MGKCYSAPVASCEARTGATKHEKAGKSFILRQSRLDDDFESQRVGEKSQKKAIRGRLRNRKYKNAFIINAADISRVRLVDLLFLLLSWQEECN
jgi:hypothetical protein